MRLTDEYLDYEPARPIVFDDSYEHEVGAACRSCATELARISL